MNSGKREAGKVLVDLTFGPFSIVGSVDLSFGILTIPDFEVAALVEAMVGMRGVLTTLAGPVGNDLETNVSGFKPAVASTQQRISDLHKANRATHRSKISFPSL